MVGRKRFHRYLNTSTLGVQMSSASQEALAKQSITANQRPTPTSTSALRRSSPARSTM
ncbi:MAG: hypothetical protein ACLU0O_03860 [Collinsella sp.]